MTARTRQAAPVRRIAAAGVLLAVALSCGRKTDVRPPELVAPEMVQGVEARNVAEGVRLTWRRPRRYVDGSTMPDLAGFRLERSVDGAPFAMLNEVEVTDRERFRKVRRFRFTDTNVEMGRQYRYRVYAFTADGHVSRVSEVAGVVREAPQRRETPQGSAEAPR